MAMLGVAVSGFSRPHVAWHCQQRPIAILHSPRLPNASGWRHGCSIARGPTSCRAVTPKPQDAVPANQPSILNAQEDEAASIGTSNSNEEQDLEEKERLRRQRISEANQGRQPWNKGRKHSPETIAKIKERTRAAMSRPEVVEAYKAGVAKHMRQHSDETKQKIKEAVKAAAEERKAARERAKAEAAAAKAAAAAAKPKRVRRKAGEGDSSGESDGSASDTEGSAPKRKRASRAKSAAVEGSAEGSEPKQPKQRAKPSEEHRRNIAEAIRRKWQDPNYRQKAVSGIRQHVHEKFGIEPGTSRRQRKADGTTPTKRAAKPSVSAARRKEVEARLAQVRVVVAQVLQARSVVAKCEFLVESTRNKVHALLNDSRTAAKAQFMIEKAEGQLALARNKLQQLNAMIPAGVKYDAAGNVHVSDPAALFAQPAAGPAAQDSAADQAAEQAEEEDEEVDVQGASAAMGAAAEQRTQESSLDQAQMALPLTLQQPATKVNGVNGVHVKAASAHASRAAAAPLSAHALLGGSFKANGVATARVNGVAKANGTAVNGIAVNGVHVNGHTADIANLPSPDAWVKAESVEKLLRVKSPGPGAASPSSTATTARAATPASNRSGTPAAAREVAVTSTSGRAVRQRSAAPATKPGSPGGTATMPAPAPQQEQAAVPDGGQAPAADDGIIRSTRTRAGRGVARSSRSP